MKWALYVDVRRGVRMCVVNIVNPAVDWPPLLHTFTDCYYSWSG